VCTEFLVDTLVRTFSEQVQVELAQGRRKPIRILGTKFVAIAKLRHQAVPADPWWQFAFENVAVLKPLQLANNFAGRVDEIQCTGVWTDCPHHASATITVRPEYGKWVIVSPHADVDDSFTA
jgi:hypothetical protein